MGKMRSILLVCAVLTVLGVRQCLSCSCQPEHPTQQYCRAQYVIKAKVVSKQQIYPTEEPVVEPLPTIPPEKTQRPSPSYDIEPHVLPSDLQSRFELLPPGPAASGPLLPPSGGLRAPSGGLRAPSGGLMPPSGGLRAPSGVMGGGLFPPGGMFPGQNEPRPIELEYTIKVDKIFKVDEEVNGLDPKTIVKIYTAPWDGMCGVSWLENGRNYLLSGSYWDGKLRISTCNWIDLYNDLTRRQKQGVKSAYKSDCYDSDIKTTCQICFHEGCAESPKDLCIWDPFTQYEDCESLHSRCTRNSKGKCQWQRKKEYKKCDLQRQQEKTSGTPDL